MEAQRVKRDKAFRTARRVHSELQEFMDRGDYIKLNVHTVTNRGTEYTNVAARILAVLEILDDETEEANLEADAAFRREFTQMTDHATTLCNDLVVLKIVSRLLVDLEKDVKILEDCKAEEPDKDYTACYRTSDKSVDQIKQALKDSSIDMDHLVYHQMDLLAKRVLTLKTQARIEVKPPTIIAANPTKDFDTPKVNIPKFKGGMIAWHAFWSRFKPAVHENKKIQNPVKMAMLSDLVDDPALSSYLLAQSDGREDRYPETIKYLQGRFDKPKQLHQAYCRQLQDLSKIKGTSEELSLVADEIFAAVQGIKREGQTDIDYLATSMTVSVLPDQLRLQWETKIEASPLVPHIDEFIAFLRTKAENAAVIQKHTPETTSAFKRDKKQKPSRTEGRVYTSQGEPAAAGRTEDSRSSKSKYKQPKVASTGSTIQCTLCPNKHFIFQCKMFLDMTVQQRRDHTQGASLCFNCLRTGHSVKDCQSTYRCRLCKKNHNTLLHTETATPTVSVNHVTKSLDSSSAANPPQQKERLLMTSQVLLTNSVGEKVVARAMLDSGAAISVLSSKMMAKLQLPRTEEWMTVTGVESQTDSPSRPTAYVNVSSLSNPGWSSSVKVVILPKVAANLPAHDLTALTEMPHLKGLKLADPLFHQPRRIDLILDADIVDEVMLPKKVEGPPSTPSAWETRLGWGIAGRYLISQTVPSNRTAVNVTAAVPTEEDSLNTTLERFFKLEEMPQGSPILSTQELSVQRHFSETHYFHPPAGRYVVSLPKRTTTQELGESLQIARTRYLRNEQALLRKGNWAQFQTVVQEYLTLGHAQKATRSDLCTPVGRNYYLPMHAVYKASSSSTKLRVVFDASCPTSTGVSLNDILSAGPTLHPNLDQILIRFRKHRVAVSADIGKMYREVLLSKPDRHLHRFVWRSQPDQQLETYHMTRVTFGVKSSPYLAVRALQQTATDFSDPKTIEYYHTFHSFYVDDLLAGADDTASAITLFQALRALLLKAGFDLKKWRSSSAEVLAAIPSELQEALPEQEMIDQHANAYPKTLGIAWDSRRDVMAAQVQLPDHYVSTKRGIISDTAKSFDVLGWLAPFIINMKILFQLLWKEKGKMGWDDPLEEGLVMRHQEWREQLSELKTLTLPRCYFSAGAPTSIQLHGFADASKDAYAAAVYLRATYPDGSISCRLVVAKTRVAPLKTVSIPRLELCAAVMLAELLDVTKQTLQISDVETWAWSDSTITLCWLRSSPSHYKTFIANRVATAARHISQEAWLHVPSEDNPADCASRGISAQELRDHHLWWGGPPWLLQEPVAVPRQPGIAEVDQHKDLEAKPVAVYAVDATPDIGWQSRFNTYSKLSHVTAYVLRFLSNLKAATQGRQLDKAPVLSPAEIKAAESILFKNIQARAYGEELKRLSAETPSPLQKNSDLRLVHPFVSQEGLLLVGGRLGRSSLPSLQRNPIILSSRDRITRLLFEHVHISMSHCGPTLLLSQVGLQVYVPGAKRLAREVCQGCILCKRAAPRSHQQKMGQLPPPRVEISLCFVHTGVDYAGPFSLKTGHPRRPIEVKGYLAVFVCLATKAVHFEVVSSKTTEAFVATFKRFITRRNVPGHMYSDNGSNFIGARNELKELFDFLSLSSTQISIQEALQKHQINWHFIPDRAPHFGGIWEAAVKSAKYCLKRAVRTTMLTFEELSTVFCQAEACLNSRPYLSQDSHDPAGEMPLTPGHFLTGRPMGVYPELPEEPDLTVSNRWKLCTAMVQEFWQLWQKQYLQSIQKARKWHRDKPNVKQGDLVMVLEESTLQTNWKMGKVLSVSPGSDGLVRTAKVQVKTAVLPNYPRKKPLTSQDICIKTSTYQRPITKLAPLLSASPKDSNMTVCHRGEDVLAS